jgi:hypothetical protein
VVHPLHCIILLFYPTFNFNIESFCVKSHRSQPDGQVIIAQSEDELQMAVNELNKLSKKYDMKISTSKTKAIGVCGKNIQHIRIKIEGKTVEQVSNFNYVGSLMSNEEKNINAKLQTYNKMNGKLNNTSGNIQQQIQNYDYILSLLMQVCAMVLKTGS